MSLSIMGFVVVAAGSFAEESVFVALAQAAAALGVLTGFVTVVYRWQWTPNYGRHARRRMP